MYKLSEEQSLYEHQRDLWRLERLRPIDDDLMRCLFKDDIPLAQLVLRIILDKPDLTVLKSETQADMKRVTGARSVCLDVYATDSEGKKYDIEIQRSDLGSGAHRARYHSSVMDVENLDAGDDFEKLPDTYTIFITENDTFGDGEPVHIIERVDRKTGEPFNDGSHILYVNGQYKGDTPLGDLMHDFNCTAADDMRIVLLAEKTRYYKEHSKGVSDVCRIMEEMRNETFERAMALGIEQGIEQGIERGIERGIEQGHAKGLEQGELNKARDIALSMYAGGLSMEEIVRFIGYPAETIREWLKEKEQ